MVLSWAVKDESPFPKLLSLLSPAAGRFETIVLYAQRKGELLLHVGAQYRPSCVRKMRGSAERNNSEQQVGSPQWLQACVRNGTTC